MQLRRQILEFRFDEKVFQAISYLYFIKVMMLFEKFSYY